MSTKKRIAIALELAWLYKHHQDTFAGTQQYAQQCGDWECYITTFPERFLKMSKGSPHYDGILARATPSIVAAACDAGVPLVNVWYSSPVTDDVVTVAPDNVEVGRMAARHLLARGLRNFCFFGATRDESASREHLQGFSEVIKEARFPLETIRVSPKFDETASACERFHVAMEKWIPGQKLPVGVLCDRDTLCRYVTHGLIRSGVNVPHEAALIGVGNEEVICIDPEPSLTSIDRGHDRVGFHAAELLDRMIEGEDIAPQTIYLPPGNLIPRQSTDALAVENDMVAAALRFIADECHHPINVGDVAAAVKVSRRTLDRRFREVMGETIIGQINQQRIERAKRLLVEGDALIKQIAKECGFAGSVPLCHAFTRLVGISPRAFREQAKRK